ARAEVDLAPREPGASSRLLEVTVSPGSAPADGNAVVHVGVRLLDPSGAPIKGTQLITLESSLGRWAVPDLDRDAPGIQARLDDGVGEFSLIAPSQPGQGEVRVTADGVSSTQPVTFVPADRPLMAAGLVEARLDLRSFSPSALTPARPEDGFEQTLESVAFDQGDLHGGVRSAMVLKGKVKGDYLLTLAYDTEKDADRTLFRDIQPDQFYPVYGDASVKEFDAQTSQRFYVRVDRDRSFLLYGDFNTAAPNDAVQLSRFDRSLTGAVQHIEGGRGAVDVFATKTHATQVVDEVPGLGISGPYTLTRSDGLLNSEKVEILTRDRNQPDLVLKSIVQERFTDYEFEPFSGRILFRAPVPSVDADLNPVSIRVTYEVENGGDAFWTYGAKGKYRVAERLEVGGTFAEDDNPLAGQRIWGLNSTFALGSGSYLLGEFGQTENSGISGSAERAEFRHRSEGLDLRVYGARSDSGFVNPSSTLGAGRLELGLRGAAALDRRTRLIAEALRTEDRIAGGHREGASFSVERRLTELLKAELGYRYGRETAAPASPLTAGATPNETNAIRGRVSAQTPGARATVFAEYEQDVVETDQHRGAIGGELRVAPRVRLYGRHEWITSLAGPYALNGVQHLQNTVLGIDADYYRSNQVFGEYRARDAFSGREAEAAMGLRNRWMVAPGWLINTSAERVSPLAGSDSGRATAVTGAVEYTGSPLWKGSARLEYRSSTSGDNFLATLGYARKLDRDLTLLARSMWNAFGDQWREHSELGLAVRQTDTDRWNGLFRYEHRFERLDVLGARRSHHVASVIAAVVNFQPRRSLTLSWRYAGKLASDEISGQTTNSNAQLIMGRGIVDLSPRWDAGLISSLLFSHGVSSRQYGLGVEAGRRLLRNLRLAVGYNFFGFSDRDLTSVGYTTQGPYVDLGFKFDETLFGAGGAR
ncbi:MAG TPA: hypothetical protein VK688_07275, partial [Gemmatimonadales bacterium]|nr:hypothetical protein [Gemmatimonadales bacterium]